MVPQNKSTPTPVALIENVMHLVSLPEVYLRVQAVLDDPLHTRDDVSKVISYDPSLSARILRIANCAYYGYPCKVENIPSAISVIGEADLRNIVLAASVVNSMSAIEPVGIDIGAFWLHSVCCGVTASLIGKKVRGCNSERLFLAGILHDLGLLILYRRESELANAVDWHRKEHRLPIYLAEQDLLGFDHAEIGGLLAEAWLLTPELCELIRYHHRPELATANLVDVQVLSLANHIIQEEFDSESFSIETDSDIYALIRDLELDISEIPELLKIAQQQSKEIERAICG